MKTYINVWVFNKDVINTIYANIYYLNIEINKIIHDNKEKRKNQCISYCYFLMIIY